MGFLEGINMRLLGSIHMELLGVYNGITGRYKIGLLGNIHMGLPGRYKNGITQEC